MRRCLSFSLSDICARCRRFLDLSAKRRKTGESNALQASAIRRSGAGRGERSASQMILSRFD
jgi:hypothetical protein